MQRFQMVMLICLGCLVLGLAASGVQAGMWTPAAQPEDSDPTWEFTGDLADRTFVQDEYLRMDTYKEGANGYHVFAIINQTEVMDWSVRNVLQFRVRVGDVVEDIPEEDRAASVAVYSPTGDGKCNLHVVRLGAGRVGLTDETKTHQWVEVDTAQWHDYAMLVDPQGGDGGTPITRLYQDGVLIGEEDPLSPIGLDWNGVRWGDQGGPAQGVSDWSYVGWAEDAVIPEPATIWIVASGLLVLLAAAWRRRRS